MEQEIPNKIINNPKITYNLPIEIVDDSLKHTRVHMNATKITTVHRPASYVLTELNSYARHIYNVIFNVFFLFKYSIESTLFTTINNIYLATFIFLPN